jgi:hypothetical protein
MKKNIAPVSEVPELTIGIDLSGRTFRYCALKPGRQSRRRRRTHVEPESLRKCRTTQPEAVVAKARELRAVTARSQRSHFNDARQLARVGGELLKPVWLRNAEQQADMFVVRAPHAGGSADPIYLVRVRDHQTTGRRLPDRFSDRVRQVARQLPILRHRGQARRYCQPPPRAL